MPKCAMKHIHKATIKAIKAIDPDLVYMFIKGSSRQGDTWDYWSDVDLVLVTSTENIPKTYKTKLDKIFEPIQGKQVYDYEGCMTYRVTGGPDGLLQFDLQILTLDFYGQYNAQVLQGAEQIFGPKQDLEHTLKDQGPTGHVYDPQTIDDLWFIMYEGVKKIARSDNLIGLHLIFDLVRKLLVMDMVDRDIAFGTHIHRYGQKEHLPASLKLQGLQTDDPIDKLNFLLDLAQVMDQRLSEYYSDYQSRLPMFKKHIDQSIRYLSKPKEI